MDEPFGFETAKYLEWYREEPLVAGNGFRLKQPNDQPLPIFAESMSRLPSPWWPNNPTAISAYWKAWELAFSNLRSVNPESKLIENYIDTAFNDCLFMWDSVFMLHFGRYGRRAFDFQKTLDNFYSRQHLDGFICREIRSDGSDQWSRYDPASTGPSLLSWSEWESYLHVGDKERLARVFPALCAYHEWVRKERSWPDGTYWSTGLGCGMDNLRRLPPELNQERDHGWLTWIDATAQACLDARCLAAMASVLDLDGSVYASEAASLASFVEDHLWNEARSFYCDRDRNGRSSHVRHIGGFWALAAKISSQERAREMATWLDDDPTFCRHHPVPSLAADEEGYRPDGGYWLGGVWAPTNYLVLRGLWNYGLDVEAHKIARLHHQRVVEIFSETGTFWENHAPDASKPGDPAKGDFVGWGGLPPITVLLEGVFGIRPGEDRLIWDIRLCDEFGVDQYPVGLTNTVSLKCESRLSEHDEPIVTILTKEPISIELRWAGGARVVSAAALLR